MTCKEQLKLNRPELFEPGKPDITKIACPHDLLEMPYPVTCDQKHLKPSEVNCIPCWNREVPGTEKLETIEKETKTPMATTKKTKAQLIEELKEATERATALEKDIKELERYKQYVEAAGEMHALYQSFVNSGFSETQAYDLMKMMLQTAFANNMSATIGHLLKVTSPNVELELVQQGLK